LKNREVIEIDDEDDSIVISCEEEEIPSVKYEVKDITPDQTKSSGDFSRDDAIEAWKFGEVVDLDFLRVRTENSDHCNGFTSPSDDDLASGTEIINHRVNRQESNQLKRPPFDVYKNKDTDDEQMNYCDESAGKARDETDMNGSKFRLQKRRKMSKYSRDGGWYPDEEMVEHNFENNDDWFDTDSNSQNGNIKNDKSSVGDVEKQTS